MRLHLSSFLLIALISEWTESALGMEKSQDYSGDHHNVHEEDSASWLSSSSASSSILSNFFSTRRSWMPGSKSRSLQDELPIGWKLIGSEIIADQYYDRGGHAVAMNANGTRIAFGAYNYLGGRGQVKIFDVNVRTSDYDDDNDNDDYNGAEIWEIVGRPITGLGGDELGSSICFNAKGDIIAIGAPSHSNYLGTTRVYSFNADLDSWTPVGVDIDGLQRGDGHGTSVSLNGDGDRLAIGASDSNKFQGYVAVYSFNGGTWEILGQIIRGGEQYYGTGSTVSLNYEGNRLIISSPIRPGDAQRFVGGVDVYEYTYNESAEVEEWVRMGGSFQGNDYYELFGDDVDINGLGDMIAIGVTNANIDSGATKVGMVQVYQYNEGLEDWEQVGTDIVGDDEYDGFGFSVSMNDKGDRVVIGAVRADQSGSIDSGEVKVFDYNAVVDEWVQIGETIPGECAGDESGHAVDMSADGNRIIIGAPLYEYYTGHIRIFEGVPGYDGEIQATCFGDPTNSPTATVTNEPTASPSTSPTTKPSATVTNEPTTSPSSSPSSSPTALTKPLNVPTIEPSSSPTSKPSSNPSFQNITKEPSMEPSMNMNTVTATSSPSSTPLVRVTTKSPKVTKSKSPKDLKITKSPKTSKSPKATKTKAPETFKSVKSNKSPSGLKKVPKNTKKNNKADVVSKNDKASTTKGSKAVTRSGNIFLME